MCPKRKDKRMITSEEMADKMPDEIMAMVKKKSACMLRGHVLRVDNIYHTTRVRGGDADGFGRYISPYIAVALECARDGCEHEEERLFSPTPWGFWRLKRCLRKYKYAGPTPKG